MRNPAISCVSIPAQVELRSYLTTVLQCHNSPGVVATVQCAVQSLQGRDKQSEQTVHVSRGVPRHGADYILKEENGRVPRGCMKRSGSHGERVLFFMYSSDINGPSKCLETFSVIDIPLLADITVYISQAT